MAMNPTKFAATSNAPLANTTVYTVAAGKQAILKQIIVANPTTAAVEVYVTAGPAGTGPWVFYASVPAKSTSALDMTQVLNAADTITWFAAAANISISASGVVFP